MALCQEEERMAGTIMRIVFSPAVSKFFHSVFVEAISMQVVVNILARECQGRHSSGNCLQVVFDSTDMVAYQVAHLVATARLVVSSVGIEVNMPARLNNSQSTCGPRVCICVNDVNVASI